MSAGIAFPFEDPSSGSWENPSGGGGGDGEGGGDESGNGRPTPATGDIFYYNFRPDGTYALKGTSAPAVAPYGTWWCEPNCGPYGDGEFAGAFSDAFDGGMLLSEDTNVCEEQIFTIYVWHDFPRNLTNSVPHMLFGKKATGFSYIPPWVRWAIFVVNDKSIIFAYANADGSGTETIQTDPDVYPPGRHLLVVVSDGESVYLYIDGVLAASDTLANSFRSEGKGIVIGAVPVGGLTARYSPGRVAALAFMPGVVFSSEDVAGLYATGRQP